MTLAGHGTPAPGASWRRDATPSPLWLVVLVGGSGSRARPRRAFRSATIEVVTDRGIGSEAPQRLLPSGTVAFLFTDVEGSTRL